MLRARVLLLAINVNLVSIQVFLVLIWHPFAWTVDLVDTHPPMEAHQPRHVFLVLRGNLARNQVPTLPIHAKAVRRANFRSPRARILMPHAWLVPMENTPSQRV